MDDISRIASDETGQHYAPSRTPAQQQQAGRQYKRDPKGTHTGGQFTRNPSGASTAKPAPKKAVIRPVGERYSDTLGRDANNDPQQVAELQSLLSALGLGNVSSGQYDSATEAAVREAQRRLGIKKPNGRASRSLIGKLLNAYDLSPCIKRSGGGDGLDILRAEFGVEEHIFVNGLCATCGED